MRIAVLFVTSFSSILMLICTAQEAEQETAKTPKLEISTDKIDFGLIYPEERPVQLVVLQNTGQAELKLGELSASCICAEAILQDATIPPGGTSVLEVHAVVDEYPTNEAKSIIRLETNDPDLPVAEISVSAEILPEYTVAPDEVLFSQVKKGVVHEQLLLLESCCQAPLEIVRLEATAHLSVAEVAPEEDATSDAEGRVRWFKVQLDEAVPEGRFSGKIIIHTNVKRVPSVTVPVRAEVMGINYTIEPSVLTFQGVHPGDMAATLSVKGDGELQVNRVETDIPGLESSVEERERGRRYNVRLRVANDAKAGRRHGLLRLHLEEGSLKKTVEVSVYGDVQ